MDSFEKLFHKLYPKTLSNKIKLIAVLQNHIEKLEKEKILDEENFRKDEEIVKWQTIIDMLNAKVPLEEIDDYVLSDVFSSAT